MELNVTGLLCRQSPQCRALRCYPGAQLNGVGAAMGAPAAAEAQAAEYSGDEAAPAETSSPPPAAKRQRQDGGAGAQPPCAAGNAAGDAAPPIGGDSEVGEAAKQSQSLLPGDSGAGAALQASGGATPAPLFDVRWALNRGGRRARVLVARH